MDLFCLGNISGIYGINNMILDHSTVLCTGGTGSFGRAFVKESLTHDVHKIIVFSRDELKQFEMRQEIDDDRLSFFLGDIRDRDRLYRAFDNVDFVCHAAALKQVPALEYSPLEAIKTNIMGAANIIDAAFDCGVKKVIALSSDKAVSPVNLYGATKLAMEKLFVAGNSYAGDKPTRFSIVRYGNVAGSRGSVIPFFREKIKRNEPLPITDEHMTRFWLTLQDGVRFVTNSIEQMRGGEIFVPKLPSVKITDIATALLNLSHAKTQELKITGIRPGEKLHESLINESESRTVMEYDDYYIIQPIFKWWHDDNGNGGRPVPDGFRYSSDTNEDFMSISRLKEELCRI